MPIKRAIVQDDSMYYSTVVVEEKMRISVSSSSPVLVVGVDVRRVVKTCFSSQCCQMPELKIGDIFNAQKAQKVI